MNYTDLVNDIETLFTYVSDGYTKIVLRRAADAIKKLQSIVPRNCFCCVGREIEPKDGSGCDTGFVLSAERAKSYLEALSKMENTTPKWIPVEERLPEDDGFYMCFVERKNKFIDIFRFDVDEGEFFVKDLGDIVTHWQPLPEPPKEEQT